MKYYFEGKVIYDINTSLNISLNIFNRCGSGLSGECLSEHGHFWVGIDISEHMLRVLFHK